MDTGNLPFQVRVALLGNPNSSDPFKFWRVVPWSDENLERLKTLGFNTIQVNVAWGPRPGDEPLNLEDIIELPANLADLYPQPVPLNCDPSPERRTQRRKDMLTRSAACHRVGLRTIFHFGAPYNAHMRYGDGPPNCISDEKTVHRYEVMLDRFANEFYNVDDILVYTYDQDAWLCSEFGPCPRCLGIPLHERLTAFLGRLAAAWQRNRPTGRLWWEPWELSAGQVYQCVSRLPSQGMGLALHANVAEVMATSPADRWLKNTAALASDRQIPVIVEYWLGGPSEELEPLLHLSHPLVTYRALQAIASIPGVTGIKEYYGIDPDREDPNLRMTGLFLNNAGLTEDEAVRALAQPYREVSRTPAPPPSAAPNRDAAQKMIQFWQHTSRGMELFPWDASWFMRQIGRSRVDHALSAARIRGMPCRTPSWCSTRATIFLKSYEDSSKSTDQSEDDPWLLEDIELRCRMAASAWQQALALGEETLPLIPPDLKVSFERNLLDLGRLYRRSLAYACHMRETNLAQILRRYPHHPAPSRILEELRQCLQADLANYTAEQQADADAIRIGLFSLNPSGTPLSAWVEAEDALRLLIGNLENFLTAYLQPTGNPVSKGLFSVTSR